MTSRDLRLFYAFRLLATSYLYVPIFMLFQEDRGLSHLERMALGGLYSVVLVVAEVPTGVFADRFGRRRAMQLGALAMVASSLCAVGAHSFTAFAVAEVLAALSIALCSGADSAYLYDLLVAAGRRADYPRRESSASAWHLGGAAIAYLGGGALAAIDLALPYVVTAVVAAAAVVVACLLREAPRPPPSAVVWSRQVSAAIGEVARSGRLLWLVGYSVTVFVLLRVTVYVYQPYLAARGFDLREIGAVFAGAAIASALVASRTFALRRWLGDEVLTWGILGVLALSFVGLAGSGAGPWMFALLVAQAGANGVYSPLVKLLLNQEIVDSDRRAAILSTESMGRRIGMAVFIPLAGLSAQGDVMLVCGLAGVVGLAALLLASRKLLWIQADRSDR
jgi:MFS family permease